MEIVVKRLDVTNNSSSSDSPDDSSKEHESDNDDCAVEDIEPLHNF
jgi:hypothetical protein